MADRHTKQQRSKNMSAVQAKGNKTTEIAFMNLLRTFKITGWRRHPTTIMGKPDFLFLKQKVVVFLDGCFWHGCRTCRKIPASNTAFWKNKIVGNKIRDKAVTSSLRKNGWNVIRIWEHQLKESPEKVILKLKNLCLNWKI